MNDVVKKGKNMNELHQTYHSTVRSSGAPNPLSKRDLVLLFLDEASQFLKEQYKEDKRISYTRLTKSLYLLERKMFEKYGEKPKYHFESFVIHTGLFDSELIRDLQIWEFLGLLKNLSFPYRKTPPEVTINSHDITLTDLGKDYARRYARRHFIDELGSQAFNEFKKSIAQYIQKEEQTLIQEANIEWSKESKDRHKLIEEFL